MQSQEAQLSERETELREAEAIRLDQIIDAGRLLPRERDEVLAFLEAQGVTHA
ncbi:hypothetical protein [Thioalkalivibrio sp. ALE6]|uniref:hypothetical protein n=1 Tax=Thioalkalivibrio sp. ALE6 TaxID=1266908 RepID=UPI0018C8CCDC|nr:hypothetical protein [Thioalkalivibrio sp. ALE6]